MRNRLLVVALAALCSTPAWAETNEQLREQVRKTEIAFAKTMADRDHAAFVSFLADETVFFGRTVLRGKAAVADAWKRFYQEKEAPFAWEPDAVEVLDSGRLAFSSGPVWDPKHQRVGTFNSVWRREKDGKWKIVFDKGCPDCECPTATPSPPSPKPGS